MRKFYQTLLVMAAATIAAHADDDKPRSTATVTTFGAKCDGTTDDTAAFVNAIAATVNGGVVTVPSGRCVISQPLVMNRFRAVSFIGTGNGSQIFQKSDTNLFDYQTTSSLATSANPIPPAGPDDVGVGVSALIIKDLSLGSAAKSEGTSLIKLTNASHMRIENISMTGSYYGIYLNGSLINTLVNVSAGQESEQSFFAARQASRNQAWVYGDRVFQTSANTNTFISPRFSGGKTGIQITDHHGEGSLYIFGGRFSGQSGKSLILDGPHLPSTITDTQFSSNGLADVEINAASNIRISDVRSEKLIDVLGDSRNISVNDSRVQRLHLDLGNKYFPGVPPAGSGVKRVLLQNITTCLNRGGSSGIDPAPVFSTSNPTGLSSPIITNGLFLPIVKYRQDIIYSNIRSACNDD